MRHLLPIFAAISFVAFAVSASHAANLIKNGSFESPVVPDGGGMLSIPATSYKAGLSRAAAETSALTAAISYSATTTFQPGKENSGST